MRRALCRNYVRALRVSPDVVQHLPDICAVRDVCNQHGPQMRVGRLDGTGGCVVAAPELQYGLSASAAFGAIRPLLRRAYHSNGPRAINTHRMCLRKVACLWATALSSIPVAKLKITLPPLTQTSHRLRGRGSANAR